MSKWTFTGKIEEMGVDELKRRIKEAYEYKMPKIVPIPYMGDKVKVEYKCNELVSLCPMTGYADLNEVIVTFIPDKFVPELKSLRFYFMAYKELPISHEHLASKIRKEFREVVKPKSLEVVINVAPRGGIYTRVTIGGNR